MPKLQDLIHGYRPQTREEREAVIRQAADVFGLKIRRLDKKRVRIVRPH